MRCSEAHSTVDSHNRYWLVRASRPTKSDRRAHIFLLIFFIVPNFLNHVQEPLWSLRRTWSRPSIFRWWLGEQLLKASMKTNIESMSDIPTLSLNRFSGKYTCLLLIGLCGCKFAPELLLMTSRPPKAGYADADYFTQLNTKLNSSWVVHLSQSE